MYIIDRIFTFKDGITTTLYYSQSKPKYKPIGIIQTIEGLDYLKSEIALRFNIEKEIIFFCYKKPPTKKKIK
ncbi:MAG: hypothetical protein M0R17_08590 [Candidatus Omnitrophica bacterium]|jgi:hypothetical protein|nr:hypothetical protein [Candidatus Omnitrophota bacterium]